MPDPVSSAARQPGQLPWPDGWARRTRGPQYRPAVLAGLLCLPLAAALAIGNPADGILVAVFAAGLFIWALRPAPRYPIRVDLADIGPGQRGARFPLRINSLFVARRPSVTLTPTAVVADAGTHLVIPWSQITEVRAAGAATGLPHPLLPAPRQNWLTISVLDASAVRGTRSRLASRFGANTVAGIATTSMLFDPVVLYHTLHYYLDNPHARPELAGDFAVERIRRARVEPHDT